MVPGRVPSLSKPCRYHYRVASGTLDQHKSFEHMGTSERISNPLAGSGAHPSSPQPKRNVTVAHPSTRGSPSVAHASASVPHPDASSTVSLTQLEKSESVYNEKLHSTYIASLSTCDEIKGVQFKSLPMVARLGSQIEAGARTRMELCAVGPTAPEPAGPRAGQDHPHQNLTLCLSNVPDATW